MTMYAMTDADGWYMGYNGLPDASDFTGPPTPPPDGPYTYTPIPAAMARPAGTPAAALLKLVGESWQWIDPRTLDEAKVQAWMRIKASRDIAEAADFSCAGNVYQADRERINGAVTMAVLAQLQSQPYSIVWTLSDNSTVTLDGPGMMAVGAALGQRTKDVFNTGVSLRAQKDAATTNAAADAISWPA